MQDQDKTKTQLIDELNQMSRKVAELETAQVTAMDVENAPLSYQLLDENGCFLAVNKAWLSTMGYSREEVVGKWFGDFLAPGYQEHFKINFPGFKAAGEIHGVEFEMVRKDGSIISVTFEGQILRDQLGGFKQTHCIFQEITKRKRAEEARRQTEEKFKTLIETTDTGYAILDSEGKVTDANKEYLRFSGHKALEEIIGRRVTEWTAEHDQKRAAAEVAKCLQQGFVRNLEIDHVDNEGHITPIEINATALEIDGSTHIMVLYRDITERKQAEEILQVEKEKLRGILDSMNDGVYMVNARHEIEYINPVIETSFGSVDGRKCYEYFHDRTDPCPWCKDKEVFAGESVQWEWSSFKTGKTYELFDTPVRNSDGSISKIEFFHDITERKRAEERLQESEQRYRSLVEHLPQRIFIKDRNSVYLSCNSNYASDRGITPEQIVDKDDFAFFTPELAQKFRADDQACMDTGMIKDIEEEVVRRFGTVERDL